MSRSKLLVLMLIVALGSFTLENGTAAFEGGLREGPAQAKATPIPVRNHVAQPNDPIVTKRYFKIKKGSFPEFLKASQEGVWPFFEKIGSRVIGMWQVMSPEGMSQQASPEYDEVYLMTQYASLEHWRATREMAQIGGNGPDWFKARQAIAFRRSLTIETNLQFLRGSTWHSPPYYMPGLGETFTETK